MKKGKLFKLRTFLLFLWLVLMAFFVYQKVVPLGEAKYCGNLLDKDYFVANLTPSERINNVNGRAGILGEPVYFSLQLPRHFQRAEFELKYRIDERSKLFKIGMLADDKFWRYREEPLENQLIEEAIESWEGVEIEEGKLFLQREKKFSNLKSYLDSNPSLFNLGIYNLSENDLNLPEFSLEAEERATLATDWSLPAPLRGDHQLFVYSFGENISLDLSYFDLNQNKDEDSLDLNLYYRDKLLSSEVLPDDGSSQDNGEASEIKNFNWNLGYLPEGVYKLEIRASSDIVIANLKSSTNYLVFVNKVNIYKSDEPITLQNNGSFLRAETVYPAYLQTINFKDRQLEVNKTYNQYYLNNIESNNFLGDITLEKGGIQLANNGVFAFRGAYFFDPRVKTLDQSTKLSEVSYVIADYIPVKKEGSWRIARARFDLSSVWSKDNKYNVVLSVPGIQLNDIPAITIDNLCVRVKGKNIWQKIKEVF
ncbi:MAG: hypothetical protein K9M44_01110 [Candidatus Pacebacteria bacterium]|nr:hypothetical protein [Candidatus Paceibacterota bacterium]